jgi:trans-2,3-dihydro-3-hydroxyanthranilate isomerase
VRRKFHTLDVFTDKPFSGNPLAVVVDAQGLDATRMQAIAREFNLSETVFVLEPHDPINTARLRIFTPTRELPFAGHPTVGAAVLIAKLRAADLMAREDLSVVLEEGIGTVTCSVRQMRGRAAQGRFALPQLPQELDWVADPALIAAALGLAEDDIGFEGHVPSRWSAGNPFSFVPLRSLDAISRATPDPALFGRAFVAERPAAYLYTTEVAREGSHVHARMFAVGTGITEDPATGSAVAAFAGVAVRFEAPEDGDHDLVIEQGFEMGRPSLIRLGLEIAGGELVSGSIGGAVVMVGEGTIEA